LRGSEGEKWPEVCTTPPTKRSASLLPSLLIVRAIPGGGKPTPIAVAVNARVAGRKQRDTLIQVAIEVRSGAASFRVSVRARSIRRAISLVRSSYPGAEASLVLPVEPEWFFSGDDFAGAEQDTSQRSERLLVG
jgi:hypothetical protein